MTKVTINRAFGRQPHELHTATVLLAGGVAGAAYVLTSQPFETTAIHMQLDNPRIPQYKGMLDCMVLCVRRSGFGGLYKGMTPTLLRALPSYSAAFFGYEYALLAYQRMASGER